MTEFQQIYLLSHLLDRCGDRSLEAAHRHANNQMLHFLETHYACARVRQKGQRIRILTGQLAIAHSGQPESAAGYLGKLAAADARHLGAGGQLILWLKPMPRCLITLRQLLETQQ